MSIRCFSAFSLLWRPPIRVIRRSIIRSAFRRGERVGFMDYSPQGWEKNRRVSGKTHLSPAGAIPQKRSPGFPRFPPLGGKKELDLWISAGGGEIKKKRRRGEKRVGSMDYSPQGWEKNRRQAGKKSIGSMDFRRRRGENKGIARGERKELDLWITARRAGRKTAAQRKDPSIARRSDTTEKISRISKISALRRGKRTGSMDLAAGRRKKPRQRPITPGSSPTSSPPRCRYCPLRRHFRAPWCPAGG